MKQKYRISNTNYQDGWISIQDSSSDYYDEESFTNLVKLFQQKCSGAIRDVGDMQYEIEGLPVELIFQWDNCFGNVIIAKNKEELDRVVEYVKRVLEID